MLTNRRHLHRVWSPTPAAALPSRCHHASPSAIRRWRCSAEWHHSAGSGGLRRHPANISRSSANSTWHGLSDNVNPRLVIVPPQLTSHPRVYLDRCRQMGKHVWCLLYFIKIEAININKHLQVNNSQAADLSNNSINRQLKKSAIYTIYPYISL